MFKPRQRLKPGTEVMIISPEECRNRGMHQWIYRFAGRVMPIAEDCGDFYRMEEDEGRFDWSELWFARIISRGRWMR